MTTRLGDSLRRAREARGVSLDAIVQHTRIARRYLDALESGELDVLPGGAFDTGYIRSYAEFLETDPEPFLEAYAAEKAPAQEEELLDDLRRLLKRRGSSRRAHWTRWVRWGLVAAAGIGATAVGLWWAARPGKLEELPPPPSTLRRDLLPPPRAAILSQAPPEEVPRAEVEREGPVDGITVPSHGVGTGVVDRNLVGRSDRFLEGSEVWFWTRVVGGDEADMVRHVWMHEGQTVMAAELPIGSSYWRTYSRLVLPPGTAGRWAVEVRGAAGRVLARDEFVVFQRSSVAARSE